jgi:uncharacterized Tic20 family protein
MLRRAPIFAFKPTSYFYFTEKRWAIIRQPVGDWISEMTELPAPTQDERSMALLAHILSIFAGFLGPLIIYNIKRDSKFVSFHALQSVFWHLLYWALTIVLMLVLFLVFFVLVVSQIVQLSHQHGAPNPPFAIFFMFPVFWFTIVVLGLLNLVLGVVFAMKASAGEWVSYPLAGAWARRSVGI